MAKRSIINVTDFSGGYSSDLPDERMPDNMLRTGLNVYWEAGLRKRKGQEDLDAIHSGEIIQGHTRAYMNSGWVHVIASVGIGTEVLFCTDSATPWTYVEIDSGFRHNHTSGDETDRYRFAVMKVKGEDAVIGVDGEGVEKPFVIYYDSGFHIENLEEYDLRTRVNDDWYAGQYDVSEANPYFDKTAEAQSTTADDFPLATTTDGDGFYVGGILTYNKLEITNASQFDGLDYKLSKSIYQAFTNLVQDSTDLRAAGANWASFNTTDELSTLSINGNLFTKIVNSGAILGFNHFNHFTSLTNLIQTGSVTLKKGSSVNNVTRFQIRNNTAAVTIFDILSDWDNFGSSPATPGTGTLLDYNWIDSETLKIYFKCVALANLTDDIRIQCYASANATADEYTYWSEVQLIDEAAITMFPFVDGTHSADVINETFTMPDKFAVRLKVNPRFAFDSGIHRFVNWDTSLRVYFRDDIDQMQVFWSDGGGSALLGSQQFDDGSSHTNINQKLDIIVFLDLSSGGINDSMFIVIPQESGSINIDNSWSITPDIKSSDFPTLSIGNELGIQQADSEYEYLRVYEWDGVKPTITSSDDVDDYFIGKTVLLDNTYTLASYQYYQGNNHWSPLDLIQTPNWTGTAGNKTLEFNYPQDWAVWDGAEAQDATPSEVSGTLFNRFPIRVTFPNAPTSAQTADYFTVYHSQYLTQIMDGDIPHQVATHNSRLFLAAGSNINYSPVGRITDWHVYDTETFIRGGEKVQAMITHRGYLCVLKGASIYGMFGNSVDNWVIKELDPTVGSIYPSSVTVINQLVFFVGSDDYIYVFNGDMSKRVSKHIHSDFSSAIGVTNPFSTIHKGNVFIGVGQYVYRLDPDTVREGDTGDGIVSVWKYLGLPAHNMLSFSGAGDNGYLVGLFGGSVVRLENDTYADNPAGTPQDYSIDVKTKALSFNQFGLNKNYNRVKPDIEKAGNWTFTLLSDHEANNVAVTLASGTGPGQYTEDVSVPYTMDGKDLTLRFQNTSSVFAAIYGYALNVARRVF